MSDSDKTIAAQAGGNKALLRRVAEHETARGVHHPPIHGAHFGLCVLGDELPGTRLLQRIADATGTTFEIRPGAPVPPPLRERGIDRGASFYVARYHRRDTHGS